MLGGTTIKPRWGRYTRVPWNQSSTVALSASWQSFTSTLPLNAVTLYRLLSLADFFPRVPVEVAIGPTGGTGLLVLPVNFLVYDRSDTMFTVPSLNMTVFSGGRVFARLRGNTSFAPTVRLDRWQN